MNHYARLSHVKAEISGLGIAVNSDIDPIYLRWIDTSSEEIRKRTHRHFHPVTATRYYAGNGAQKMWLPHDLVSVSALTVDSTGDGTYDLTLVENTDYWLGPYEAPDDDLPYRWLELNPNGTQLYTWPGFTRAVKIAGVFGWPEILESVGTLAAELATAATSATMTAGHTAEAGDMLKIGSEQIYVSAVSTNTLTVSRAQNGTTAATHSNGASVSVHRFHSNVEGAMRMRVTHQRWDTNSGIPMGEPAWQAGTEYAKWLGLLEPDTRVVFA